MSVIFCFALNSCFSCLDMSNITPSAILKKCKNRKLIFSPKYLETMLDNPDTQGFLGIYELYRTVKYLKYRSGSQQIFLLVLIDFCRRMQNKGNCSIKYNCIIAVGNLGREPFFSLALGIHHTFQYIPRGQINRVTHKDRNKLEIAYFTDYLENNSVTGI